MKHLIKSATHTIAHLTGYSVRRARAWQCVRVLMFHEVGGYGYPASLFERQLAMLSTRFEVCPLPDAVARLNAGEIRGHEVVLTFDDGLETHATTVYPVLERQRLPGTFFVCPGLIEANEGIWPLEARARLKAMTPSARAGWRACVGAPAGATVDGIVSWMKDLPAATCRSSFVELARRSARPLDRPVHPLMSWLQLRQLDPALVTIGSHTLTHPILPRVEEDVLEVELARSRETIESRIGRACRFLCYPDGAYDERVANVARRHYDAAVATAEGVCMPGDDRFGLYRIPAARSLPLFTWRLWRPTA